LFQTNSFLEVLLKF